MTEPKWKVGDILESIHNSRRLAIVRDVFQDWDRWAYRVAEAQYDMKKKEVKFNDEFIVRGRDIWHWRLKRKDGPL